MGSTGSWWIKSRKIVWICVKIDNIWNSRSEKLNVRFGIIAICSGCGKKVGINCLCNGLRNNQTTHITYRIGG